MGIFDSRKKIYQQAKKDLVAQSKIKSDTRKHSLEIIDKMVTRIDAQMRGSRSFSDELYGNGIKQGPYAGLMSGDNSTQRRLSRMVVIESPVAQALTSTFSTLSVGRGLWLESQPKWVLLKSVSAWTDEQKSAWMKETEARYELWAKRKNISYENNQNRYSQEQQIFRSLLIDGEYFELYRYSATTKKNPLTIQIIRPEDVRQPTGSVVADGNTEEAGIEYNMKGEAVAYHIYNHTTQKTVRVLRTGTRSGRTFVNHVKLGTNRRGIGILSDIITELVKLGDYQVLELQAAVVNALYALWVKTPEGEDGIPTINTAGGIGSQGQTPVQSTVDADKWIAERQELDYSSGGLQIDNLPGGYDIVSHDTKRPNVNFGNFVTQVKKNLAAGKGLPVSVVDKQFQNNYSASRGELILAWYEIEKYRFNQSETNDLVYKMWMWGEVILEKIDAPGFLDNEDNRDAWTVAKWIGPQRPDIDPLRSFKAHSGEQNRGYRTGKQIAAERGGGDYDENLVRCKEELASVAEMQVPFQDIDVDLDDQ